MRNFDRIPGRINRNSRGWSATSAITLTLLIAMLSGCGGGGGNGQSPPPPSPPAATFELVFPGETSLTDADQITVVGVTNTNQVSSVTIKSGANDIVAMLDIDGRWRANAVPLQPGANTLVAELTTTDGTVTGRNIAVVQSSPILSSLSSVLFDPVNDRVFVADAKQLLAYNLANRELEVISSPQFGAGPDFAFARHMALAGDGAVVVLDLGNVLRVDPVTGDRSEHVVLPAGSFPASSLALDSQLNRLFTVGFVNTLHVADLSVAPPILAIPVGTPPPFGIGPGSPIDSTYVAGTDTVYAIYSSTLEVVAINGTTGEAVSQLVGQGGFLSTTVGIDYHDAEDRVLVLGLSGTVFSIDPNTGSSSVLLPAPSPPPSVTPLKSINGLTHGNGNLWTVSPTTSELISIDLSSGNQTVEVDSRVGGGAPPGFMLAGRYDSNADRFIGVSDLRIVAIDPKTGSRELLANLFEPVLSLQPPTTPPSFFLVSGMALSQDGTRAWVTDPITGTLAEVNLDNGELLVVSGPNAGSGALPDQIAGITVNPEETLAYVADRFAGRIFRYDLVTGQRDMLPEFAASLDPTEIRSLVLDANANRLILKIAPFSPASTVATAIYALDLASFELTLVADLTGVQSSFNRIPSIVFPTTQMSLSEDGNSLFYPVDGNPDIPYVIIDLTFGTIVPLGDASSGPPFFIPNAVEVAPDGRIFALDSTSALFVIDAQTGERVIVSK